MQRDDVAVAHQPFQRDVGGSQVHHLGFVSPAPRDHPTSESLEQLRRACTDSTRTHNADRLAVQFATEERPADTALTDAPVEGSNLAVHVNRQSHSQFCYGFRCVAGGVFHQDIMLLAIGQIDVVKPREGHVQELQLRAL